MSTIPLVRGRIVLPKALGLALKASILSIGTMEIVDNLIMLAVTVAIDPWVLNPNFCVTMAIAMTGAFFVAWPVNGVLLRRGKGHAVTHKALGESVSMDNRPLVIGLAAFLLGGFVASLGMLLG